MAMFLGGLMHEPKFLVEYVLAEYVASGYCPHYLMINCFWFQEGQGHGYNLPNL